MAKQIGWVPVNQRQPGQPGQYLTRRDLRVEQGRFGARKIHASILPAQFDGQRWALSVQPDFWRDMPERS